MFDRSLTIFDCDGVLVDSEVVVAATQLEFFAEQGLMMSHDAFLGRFLGLTHADWQASLIELMQQSVGSTPDQTFFAELGERIRARMAAELVAVDGALETLNELVEPRCVASSSSAESLQWKLERTNLISHFPDAVYSGDLVSQGKPAPDLFLWAAEAQSAAPSECVVIEDSVNGVLAAKRAGMRVIGLTAGRHCLPNHADSLVQAGTDQVVSSWAELGQLLGCT